MPNKHLTITDDIRYIRQLFAKEDPLLIEINQTLQTLDRAIQIGPEEGKLLQLFMHLQQVKTVVEIGTLVGYSTLWMARALPKDGYIHTIEHDPKQATIAQDFFDRSEVTDRIHLHQGKAADILPTLDGPYDMVFIDADKIGYPDYLDWADTHIRKGGLIVADNVLLFGNVYQEQEDITVSPTSWKAMRNFNERLSDETRYEAMIVPTKEGLAVARKLV